VVFRFSKLETITTTFSVLLIVVLIALSYGSVMALNLAYWSSMFLFAIFSLLWIVTICSAYTFIFGNFAYVKDLVSTLGDRGDYELPLPRYRKGILYDIHYEVSNLHEPISRERDEDSKLTQFLLALIEYIPIPIAIISDVGNIWKCNDNFDLLYDISKGDKIKPRLQKIGIVRISTEWTTTKVGWNIRANKINFYGREFSVLLFISMEKELREKENNAWADIVRVITHEINNSLTPIGVISEGLLSKLESERDRIVMRSISERCFHLRDFVARFSDISKEYIPNTQRASYNCLLSRTENTYEEVKFESDLDDIVLDIDVPFVEQVYINLLKNAVEAGASRVNIVLSQNASDIEVRVSDNGSGISNLHNIFVPLYSTKADGKGVGLPLSRKIVEAHNGHISVELTSKEGTTFLVVLPKQ